MIRSITFFLAAWLYQLVVFPLLAVLIPMQWAGHRRRVRRVAGWVAATWSRILLRIAGARLTGRGTLKIDPDQSVLFVSNHQGAFDIGIIAGYGGRPLGFVSKIEIARIPSIGTWMQLIGCIFIDRKNREQGKQVIDQAADALRAGETLVIFPEGTRSNGPEMGKFKTGAARIAIRAGVPIVPLTMKNTYKMRNRDAWWIQPAQVEFTIGQPIPTENLTEDDVLVLTEQVRDTIQDELDRPPLPALDVLEEQAV